MSEYCEATFYVSTGNWGERVRCRNKGKHQDPSGLHCGVHSDQAVEKRRRKADQKYEDDKKKWAEHYRVEKSKEAAQRAMEAFLGTEAWCPFCGCWTTTGPGEPLDMHDPDCPYLAWGRLQG